MDSKTIRAIQKLLQSGRDSVPCSGIWLKMIDETGIGHVINKRIQFSRVELSRLRATANQHVVNADILHVPMSGTRTELAQHLIDEKSSDKTVFGDLIWVSRKAPLTIPLVKGEAVTPQGAFLAITLDQLKVEAIEKILVIENGETFRGYMDLKLPEHIADALVIYRGHGTNESQVAELIKNRSQHCKAYGFYDYDPAGLCLAVNHAVTDIILPIGWQQHHNTHDVAKHFNKHKEFIEQKSMLMSRMSEYGEMAKEVGEAILDGGWSLTQEHMSAHEVELETKSLSKPVTVCGDPENKSELLQPK